jgi:2-methylcitrate dehydratase PrpD
MQQFSSIYADYAADMGYEHLKPKVIEQVKKLILDFAGVSLAGYKLMQFPRSIVSYISSLGGTPEATIFQAKKKFPAVNAAFANAACAHAIDMDDGHRFAALHPGTVVIPAALAAAELVGGSTTELIAGIVAGYEVMIRIGMAINPSCLNRGFHSTGLAGPFGAAVAAGNIMRLSREEIVSSLGLCGLQASGLMQTDHEAEGAKVKPINPARAAMSGLLSCILTQRGAKGPLYIFEGEDGFLRAVADEVKSDLLTRDLGRKFEICNVYIKFYAACRHAHAPMDAALKAFSNSQIDTSKITKVLVETYIVAIKQAGTAYATTASAGRFSIPFSVALVLIKKKAGAAEYSEENIRDQNIQMLAAKVQLLVGNKWEQVYPEKRGATVTIFDSNDRVWSAEVELAKGEPENPASLKDIYEKFHDNAKLQLSERDVERLEDGIMNLENLLLDDFISLI